MKKFCFALYAILSSAVLWAQEESNQLEITVDQPNDEWYASPWLWVAGAALIIVLLVVLSNRKETRE